MLEEYNKAYKLGKKDYQARMMKGEKPTLEVLDDILPARGSCSEVSLGLVQIPMEQIVGTKTESRSNAFAGNFMPILRENTEFAYKWAALGVLSGLSADELRFAVLADDVKTISKAPGIGKKTAQKLILELKDKLDLQEAFQLKTQHVQETGSDTASLSSGGQMPTAWATARCLSFKSGKERL